MSQKINLKYEGTEYTLEMCRESVKTMEANGFVFSQVEQKPMTMIPELIYGAFIMHHPRIKRSTVDEIWDSIEEKESFITAITEMYAETLETLTAKPKDVKNVSWKTVK